jgi:regulator of PEP synthase PpsR (kinase-PPPase family)
MKVFLVGVSDVGKTAIGRCLAEKLAVPFFDLDLEIEKFFGEPLSRLESRFPTLEEFREQTAKEKAFYLRDIRADIDYFGRTYRRSHIVIDIAGQGIEESAKRIQDSLSASPFGHASVGANR